MEICGLLQGRNYKQFQSSDEIGPALGVSLFAFGLCRCLRCLGSRAESPSNPSALSTVQSMPLVHDLRAAIALQLGSTWAPSIYARQLGESPEFLKLLIIAVKVRSRRFTASSLKSNRSALNGGKLRLRDRILGSTKLTASGQLSPLPSGAKTVAIGDERCSSSRLRKSARAG